MHREDRDCKNFVKLIAKCVILRKNSSAKIKEQKHPNIIEPFRKAMQQEKKSFKIPELSAFSEFGVLLGISDAPAP